MRLKVKSQSFVLGLYDALLLYNTTFCNEFMFFASLLIQLRQNKLWRKKSNILSDENYSYIPKIVFPVFIYIYMQENSSRGAK